MLRGQRDWDRETGSAHLQINEFFSFFVLLLVIEFLNLEEVKDHWGDSAEKGDQDGHFPLVSLNPADGTHIFGERPFNNTYALTKGERKSLLFRLLLTRRIGWHRLLLFSDLTSECS